MPKVSFGTMVSSHIWFALMVAFGLRLGATVACGASGTLNVGQNYTFTSPNYPNPYPGYSRCHWTVATPENSIVNLDCQDFDVRSGRTSCTDRFYFSPSGDLTSGDYTINCGKGYLNRNTTTNSFDVYFSSNYIWYSTAKGFQCVITVLGDPTITTTHGASSTKAVSGTTGDPTITTTPGASSTKAVSATTADGSSTTAQEHTSTESQSSCECGENSLKDSRIVNGTETEVHEWPWQVALRFQSSGQQFCGGSLISPSWVLTAAHCIVDFRVNQIFVSIGEHDTNTGSDTSHTVHRTISKKITHSDYDGNTVINDIAVIQLSTAVEYSHGISPVCLPTKLRSEMFVGEDATVTGWGTTSYQGSTSNVLLEVTLPVISNSKCARLNGFSIRNDQVCTYEEGKDSCQGDSGGPLVWLDDNGHYQQIGIVSYGIGCAAKDKPGVYTRITNYIDWIEKNTNTNFCSP